MFFNILILFFIATVSLLEGAWRSQDSTHKEVIERCSDDADDSIEIPCPLYDLECIGKNLEANSNCTTRRVWGSIPESFVLGTDMVSEISIVNATFIEQYLRVRNFDKCKVSTFFTNLKTETTVLSIECKGLIFEANRRVLQHYAMLEDECFNFAIIAEYGSISFTANLFKPNRLDGCTDKVYADIPEWPALLISANDKPTEDYIKGTIGRACFDNVDVIARDVMLNRAPKLFRIFVNSMICDFQCS